jgi:hypothetical protein
MVVAAGVDGDTPPQSALIVGFAYSSNTHHSLGRGEAATRARVVLVRFLFWSFSSTAFWNLDGWKIQKLTWQLRSHYYIFFWLHRVHREANPAAANLHRLPFFVSPWFRKRLPRGWTSVENTGSMQSTEKQLSDVVNNTISMWNIGVIHGAGGCSEICRVRLWNTPRTCTDVVCLNAIAGLINITLINSLDI